MLTTVEAYELRSRRDVYGLFLDALAITKGLVFLKVSVWLTKINALNLDTFYNFASAKKFRRKSSCFLQEKQA
jgi:hypothetical protein